VADEVDELRKDVNVALNEACLTGLAVDETERKARITLEVLALPESGPPRDDPRVLIVLAPVGRVWASLRMGRWNDEAAGVQPLILSQLMDVVRSFGGQHIYGWEFIDARDRVAALVDRVSLDVRLGEADGLGHTLDLFQESTTGPDRILDLRLWFDRLYVFRPTAEGNLVRLPTDQFAAEGVRWWDALYAGDPRTAGFGIFPGGSADPKFVRQIIQTLDQRKPSGPH